MITIKKASKHTLDYTCSCGVIGQCMFKPIKGSGIMVVEVECPMCKASEQLQIMKYATDEERKKLSAEDAELHWAIVMDNRIKED